MEFSLTLLFCFLIIQLLENGVILVFSVQNENFTLATLSSGTTRVKSKKIIINIQQQLPLQTSDNDIIDSFVEYSKKLLISQNISKSKNNKSRTNNYSYYGMTASDNYANYYYYFKNSIGNGRLFRILVDTNEKITALTNSRDRGSILSNYNDSNKNNYYFNTVDFNQQKRRIPAVSKNYFSAGKNTNYSYTEILLGQLQQLNLKRRRRRKSISRRLSATIGEKMKLKGKKRRGLRVYNRKTSCKHDRITNGENQVFTLNNGDYCKIIIGRDDRTRRHYIFSSKKTEIRLCLNQTPNFCSLNNKALLPLHI